MPLCGIRAVAKKRGESTKFFAHHSKAGCEVEHGGESPQHLAMKEALKVCIDAVPGWHAIIEYPHPSREWIIDVLAESDDLTRRIAFEVQLSSQTPDKYFARSQRYFDSGAFPVWLVPRRMEYHRTKVPVVVTGFGKTSAIPEDVSELLDLPAGQDFVKADDKLGAFVTALLRRGPSWKVGSPATQAARQKAQEDQEAAEAEASRKKAEAFEQSITEMNDRSASPESAFGRHRISTETDIFVWGSLTACWNCEKSLLVWDARSPGPGRGWTRVPGLNVKSEVHATRLKNHPEVHRVIDKWISAAKADIPKAGIQPRPTKASGRRYSAFVCPSCNSVMGQYYISRILPQKWSILSGPAVVPVATPPATGTRVQGAARTHTPAPPSPEAGRPLRCRIHSEPRQTCIYCMRAQS